MNGTRRTDVERTSRGVAAYLIQIAVLIAAMVSTTTIMSAQAPMPLNQVGLPSNGVFSGGSIDSVQLNNGNLHVDIPLLHLPGIGMDTDIHFVYDNKVWSYQNNQPSGSASWVYVNSTRNIWSYEGPLSGSITEGSSQISWPCKTILTTYNMWITTVNLISFTDGDGSSHLFPALTGAPTSQSIQCSNSPGWLPPGDFSADSSGYAATTNSTGTVTSVTDKHGRKYIFNNPALYTNSPPYSPQYFPIAVEDANGNRMTSSSTVGQNGAPSTYTLTDTVNRPITTTTSGANTQTITYADQNGITQTITINYVAVTIDYRAICQGDGFPIQGCSQSNEPEQTATATTVWLPGSFVLQDGDTYTISYNSSGFGEISSIILPTGGVISYTYGNWDGTGEQVLSRTVTVGGVSSVWNYGYVPVSNFAGIPFNTLSGTVSDITTVTDPNLNDTVYTCTVYVPTGQTQWQGIGTPPCYMTNEQIYSGNSVHGGTLLATKTTGYTTTAVTLPTSETFTWNATGQSAETDTTWDSWNAPYSLGNVTSKTVYDFGSGTHGPLLSQTQYCYMYNQNPAYAAVNLVDRLSSISVYNSSVPYSCTMPSSSNLVARTTTAYDQFNESSINGQGSLNGTSGTTQHDYSGYSSANTLRGLPTSVTNCSGPSSSPCSASITTYTDYNDLGQPTVSTDGRGHSTKYTYGAQNAFVASITSPPTANGVAHVMSPTYDLNTGLLMSQMDFNNNLTTYTYDSRMRPLTVQRPDGGSTTTSYPDANQIRTSVTEDSSRTEVTTTDLDGLGRAVSVSKTADPECGFLIVDTTYDLMDRKNSESNPHCASAQPTDGWTIYYYDAIGRVTSKQNPDLSAQNWSYSGNVVDFYDETKRHWRHTYDAAGRLTQVLEPDGTTNIGNVPTLETDYSYDTLNNLLRVDQWGGSQNGSGNDHVRQFAYDGLSRLVATNNPENASAQYPPGQACAGTTSGTRWTTCYGYDSNGNLNSKIDNRGTQITYSYDEMNRLLGKTYSDSTPPVTFTYDTVSGSGGSNTKGQLTSAVAGSGTTTAQRQITSYDSVGRLLSEQQCTPANCAQTPYVLGYQYDYTGAVTQSTNSVGLNGTSALQLNNSYDVAGRLVGIASNWGVNGTDKFHPPTLFAASASSTAPGYGPMGLQNASLGVNLQNGTTTGTLVRSYDNRGRAVFGADSGQGSIATTDSVGSITIGGQGEQQLTRANLAGTATFFIIGTVDGTHQTNNCIQYWPYPSTTCETYQTEPDSGGINIVVHTPTGTITATAVYGSGSTQASVAQSLAGSFQSLGFPATASGGSVTVQANVIGSSGDYWFTIDNSTGNSYGDFYVYGPNNSSSSGNFNGGTTAGTYYDQGTITAIISGTPVSINFGACSTPVSLASALASAINAAAGSFVSATATGQTISLTSISGGVSTNWSLSSSITYDTADFSSPSFTVSTSTNMSGGSDSPNGIVYSFIIPDTGGFDSNGNLLSVTDSVMGQWGYTYDNLNRLVGGNATSGQYSGKISSWTYDPFGNRLSEVNPYGTVTASYGTARNQITTATSLPSGAAFTYDAAGNVTYDGFNQYLYDAEGRLCAVNAYTGGYVGYFYDANGARVAKGNLSQFSCNFSPTNFTPTSSYVLGLSGEQVTELTVSGPASNPVSTWAHSNVFGSLGLLATYAPSSNPTGSSTYFALNDWLGTKRAEVGADGCTTTFTGMPFGNDVLPAGNCPDATEHHFTGKEHDAESGNDYFGARYYANSMGRMLSPDPVFASAARVMDPQQWNMYAYARNNPLTITDPTGLDFNLKCSDGETMTCSGGYQGQYVYNSDSNQFEFQKTDVDMNEQGNPSAGYSDQFGNDYTGSFDQNNGVSFTNTATNQTSSNSQFIDGSDPTQLNGSGAFTGIQGNFFDACGASSSCQGRATLSGPASAFSNMEDTLKKQSRFSTLLDGLSFAHPFLTDQWKGGPGGYAHVIKAPGYMFDMHFEGSSPGAGVTGFALHMLSTIKDIANGTASGERAKMVPEQ